MILSQFSFVCMNFRFVFFYDFNPKVSEAKPVVSHSHVSKLSTDSIALLSENRLSSGSSSSEVETGSSNGKPEVAVRRIAGKKISALFEV